ncbi:hypothetical protein [Selenomonas ruminantium]|uniref:hypothetical protein n=1 Tax=Selenomonas ruminantium TaxID=971 RepID=UPI0026EB10FF|nr:hypothetical protein [Selenomonas ruminantium]
MVLVESEVIMNLPKLTYDAAYQLATALITARIEHGDFDNESDKTRSIVQSYFDTVQVIPIFFIST